MNEEKKKRRFRLPIWAKTSIMIIVFAFALAEVAMVFFSLDSSKYNQNNYKNLATNLSATVALTIDVEDVKEVKNSVQTIVDNSSTHPISDEWGSDAWNAYIAQFDGISQMDAFIRLRDSMRRIQNVNSSDIDCIYISYIDTQRELFIYVVDDAEEEDACPPGCIDPLYDFNKGVLTNPEKGFPAYITNTEEYGYLVTAGTAIKDDDEVIAFAMVDISMTTVRKSQANRIVNLFFSLLGGMALLAIVGIIVVTFILVRPVNRVNNIAKSYDDTDPEKTHESFMSLKVNTKDEIEDLADSLKRMEAGVYDRIKQLTKMNEELSASQNETRKMTALANTDGLTGVKNKIAYDAEVERINKDIKSGEKVNFGVVMIDLNYLKNTNDEYGHDAGDEALIELTKIICDTFKHSPVYRIGGDEFVILLRGRDYNSSSSLIEIFNNEIEKSTNGKEIYKGVSAALGYSEYDPKTDSCVDDVFKRADKAMYDRKREMKKDD